MCLLLNKAGATFFLKKGPGIIEQRQCDVLCMYISKQNSS
jgi:hypothetical protein